MILSGNQNQFPSSFAPLGDLLKAFMFLSNLNDFNSSPSLPDQEFAKRKDSSKVWKEKGSKWFSYFSLSPLLASVFALLVWFAFLLLVNLVLCIASFNMFFFVFCFFFFFSFYLFCFSLKKMKSEKYKNNVCLCTLVPVYPGWPLKQSSLNFVSFEA